MRHLDLFSGIGGFALAARRVGWETVGFCEIDPYCQKVLAKHWPGVPIHSDVRELSEDAVGPVDIITGGYPCQPFSLAGQRRGTADNRHLWPEAARLIRELRPRVFVGENVAGHIGMGLDDVLADLEGLGYTWRTFVIPACAVNAPHRRDRVWIIADSGSVGSQERDHVARLSEKTAGVEHSRSQANGVSASKDAPNTECRQRPLGRETGRTGGFWECFPRDGGWQGEDKPTLDGTDDGIPARLDRLRALGNAIVPQIAEVIFRAINEVNESHTGKITKWTNEPRR